MKWSSSSVRRSEVNAETAIPRSGWLAAWPDALAFIAGLEIAGLSDWETGIFFHGGCSVPVGLRSQVQPVRAV